MPEGMSTLDYITGKTELKWDSEQYESEEADFEGGNGTSRGR